MNRSRNHQTWGRQYKVRLIERPLLMSKMVMPSRPGAIVTTMTANLSSMTNLIITSTTRPTASLTTVPSLNSTLPSAESQEAPNPYHQIMVKGPWKSKHPYASFRGQKQGRGLQKFKNPPMKQTAASHLISGNPATASSTVTANIPPARMCKR